MIVRLKNILLPIYKFIPKLHFSTKDTPKNIADQLLLSQSSENRIRSKLNMKKYLIDLSKYYNNSTSLQQEDIQQFCKTIKHFQHVINVDYFNFTAFIEKVRNVSLANCSRRIICSICEIISFIVPNTKEQTVSFYQQILNRIQVQLSNKQQLESEQLMSFLNFAFVYQVRDVTQKIINQLDKRVSHLGHKDLLNYLNKINKKYYPSPLEIQFFDKVKMRIQSEIQICHLYAKIQYYINLKKIYKIFYGTAELQAQIQNQIIQSLENINQEGLDLLLRFKNPANTVINIIIEKIMDQIQQSEDSLDVKRNIQKIFSLLQKFSEFMPSHYTKNIDKVMIFFLSNLHYSKQITKLISINFFNHKQVQKIHKQIVKQSLKNYLLSDHYIYEIVIRGIPIQQKILQQFFAKSLKDMPKIYDVDKIIKISTIAHTIFHQRQKHITKQENFKIIEEMYQKSSKYIQQLAQNLLALRYFMKAYSEQDTLQQFNKCFESIMLSYEVNFLIQRKWFQYLILTNNIQFFNRQFQSNPKANINYRLRYLSWQIKLDSKKYKNCYGTIFQIILKKYDQYIMKLNLLQLLISQQVHMLLRPDQINFLFKLLIKLFNEEGFQDYNLIVKAILSIIKSPQELIQSHRGYRDFLAKVQPKLLKLQSQFNINLLQQFIRTNTMKQTSISILNETMRHNFQLFAYCQISLNKSLNWKNKKSSQKWLPYIFRYEIIQESILEEKYQQIELLIKKSSNRNIETYLMNFELPPNNYSAQILNKLLQKYSKIVVENVHTKNRCNQLDSIILHLKSKISNQTAKQYSNLLKNAMKIYSLQLHQICIQAHALLLQECLKYEIEQQYQYSLKIIQILRHNIHKNYQNQNLPSNLLKMLIWLHPSQCLDLISFLRKYQNGKHQSQALSLLIWCIEIQNAKIVQQISLIIQNEVKRSIKINKQNWLYLKKRVPTLAEHLNKIVPVEQQETAQILHNLKVLFQGKNIVYDIDITKGSEMLIINGRYIIKINDDKYNKTAVKNYTKFYSNLLEIPQKNINLLFEISDEYSNRENINIICENLPELNVLKNDLVLIFETKKDFSKTNKVVQGKNFSSQRRIDKHLKQQSKSRNRWFGNRKPGI